MMREFVKLGFYIGVGGTVTFKNAVKIKEVVQNVPSNMYLLETDAPYLAPVPFRGKLNSSKYLPYIAKKVADTLNISFDEVAKVTSINAKSLFDLKSILWYC